MYIDKAADYVGQVQTVNGWVYDTRSSGKVAFVLVRDGTGIMQCVVAKNHRVLNRIADKQDKYKVEYR